jgi:hypothetical protein
MAMSFSLRRLNGGLSLKWILGSHPGKGKQAQQQRFGRE